MDGKNYILHFASGNKIISEKKRLQTQSNKKIAVLRRYIKKAGAMRAAGSCGRRLRMALALSFSAKTDPRTCQQDGRAIFPFDFLPERAANPPF